MGGQGRNGRQFLQDVLPPLVVAEGKPGFFKSVFSALLRPFKGSPKKRSNSVLSRIPAPATLVARVQQVTGKDRDMIKLADESIRRGHPEQAVLAYWKAARVYINNDQHLKAVSVLNSIVKYAPQDLDAYLALIRCYEYLDRKRDAAYRCLQAADLYEARNEPKESIEMLEKCSALDPKIKGIPDRIRALGGEFSGFAATAPLSDDSFDGEMPGDVPEPSQDLEPEPDMPVVAGRGVTPPPVNPIDDNAPLELDLGPDTTVPPSQPSRKSLVDMETLMPLEVDRTTDRAEPADLIAEPPKPEAPEPLTDPQPIEVPKLIPLPKSANQGPPRKFAIPDQSTVFEPGLPASLVAEQTGRATVRAFDKEQTEPSRIPDAPTEPSADLPTIQQDALEDDLDDLDQEREVKRDSDAVTRAYSTSDLEELLKEDD